MDDNWGVYPDGLDTCMNYIHENLFAGDYLWIASQSELDMNADILKMDSVWFNRMFWQFSHERSSGVRWSCWHHPKELKHGNGKSTTFWWLCHEPSFIIIYRGSHCHLTAGCTNLTPIWDGLWKRPCPAPTNWLVKQKTPCRHIQYIQFINPKHERSQTAFRWFSYWKWPFSVAMCQIPGSHSCRTPKSHKDIPNGHVWYPK